MNSKSGLSTKLAPLKKEMKSACKGVQSAAVRAFLERREKEESEKGEYKSCNLFSSELLNYCNYLMC